MWLPAHLDIVAESPVAEARRQMLARARAPLGEAGLAADPAPAEVPPSKVRRGARDFLARRALLPGGKLPLAKPSPSARSWAASAHGEHAVLAGGGGASAERRRGLGLAVLADDPVRRGEFATRMHEALANGYAPRTNKSDEATFERWEKFCVNVMGTQPWRTDVLANSGQDPEGFQEEVFLCVSALINFYDNMKPRKKSDPAADPRSAGKNIEAVRRRHLTKGITMVPMNVVKLAVKGLCREYIEKHGVATLVPDRKLPFTGSMIDDMLRAPDVEWDTYHWTAVRACFATLAEEGSRKDEVAKEKASTPFRKGRFTFASLIWKIGGAELRRPPTRVELQTLREGDGVLLKHGISKNDPFGSYFAATPSFLAYRPGDSRCACAALAQLELAAALPPSKRETTPLFGPSPGEEFTHSQLDVALRQLLSHGASVPASELHNYSVHSFRIYAACALLAAGAPRWTIKRLLRWRGDDSLEIYARINDSEWAEWTAKARGVNVESSIASRLTFMDFSETEETRMNEIALAMLSLDAATARAATREL